MEKQGTELLGAIDQTSFSLALAEAQADVEEAVHTRDELALWWKRLRPYLERDPQLSVAKALRMYLDEHPVSSDE